MTRAGLPLIQVQGVSKRFSPGRLPLRERLRGRRRSEGILALRDVSFTLQPGGVLGIVGESGSGKTTLARILLRLIQPDSGTVRFDGQDLFAMGREELQARFRSRARMIFQHPDAILNPARTVESTLAMTIRLHGQVSEAEIGERVEELLHRVGLDAAAGAKYPDELSGGEKRRIGICRALATNSDLIVADEPLSGLDVLLQERMLQLLKEEQEARGFALILISHDLERVNQVCDRVLVMYGGSLMEDLPLAGEAEREQAPFLHPYSVLLQKARTELLATGASIHGIEKDLPDGKDRESDEGCPYGMACQLRPTYGNPGSCDAAFPAMVDLGGGHRVLCHFARERAGKRPGIDGAAGKSADPQPEVTNPRS